MKLSICIPTYQRAPYLERCLSELAAVAGLPFSVEIVVSDNASTDDTARVCAEASERGLPVVYLRQDENLGGEANFVNALRAARGELAVYLADDDRLDLTSLARIVGLFDENESLSAVYAPWVTHDDATGQNLGTYYEIPGPTAFDAERVWPMWKFILEHRVFPELAVYRARDLHAILQLPRTVFWAFVWVFRLAGRGAVAFLPTPFYVHVVRPAPDLPPRRQLGVTQAATYLDRYRGGFEWALSAALRQSIGHVPESQREHALRLLTEFQSERAAIAARVAAADRDYIAAIEHHTRSIAWEPTVDVQQSRAFEQKHCMLAALQAIVDTARRTSGIRRIVLHEVPNHENVASAIRDVFGWTGEIGFEVGEPDGALVLVANGSQRDPIVKAGVRPGYVLAWTEVADCFRVHNPVGATRSTRAAELASAE